MAKNKISEWSSTPASNTDVGGINIAEGMAPSDVNNAMREMMAQIKDQQAGLDGDNFTVGGNLAVTGTSAFTGASTFTGTPSGPTAAPGTSTTQFATTQFVDTSYSKYAGNNTWTGTNVFTGTILKIPTGNLASRPAGTSGIIRYNTTYNQYEGNKTVAGPTISTLTHSTTTATAVVASKHYLTTGDTVVVSGCVPSNYNGEFLVTVVDDVTFTYSMVSDPTIDASGIGTYVRIVWGQLGGGAVGNGNNQVFVENDQAVTGDYTITANKNAMTTGPITINDGVVVAVPSGSTWVIL